MKRWLSNGAAVLTLSFLAAPVLAAADTPSITLESMLQEMTDLARLARSAPAGTRLLQFSSYDRASRIENGEKKDWFANRDIGNYLRKEQTPRGTEWVMAEVPGPGAIARMWSANAGKRIWRVYLDGGDLPVIEAKGKNLLDGLKGGLPPVFSDQRDFGYNLYLPIPFQNGGKVTVAFPDGKDRELAPLMYYHVDVRTFPSGTTVETFSWEGLKSNIEQIRTAMSVLSEPDLLIDSAAASHRFLESVQPGESVSFTLDGGPAAVRELEITVAAESDKALIECLGKTLIQINFDGGQIPQVSSPLGEFFGASPGLVPYTSLPLTINKVEVVKGEAAGGAKVLKAAGLRSRWVMPYNNTALITLTNFSDSSADYHVDVITSSWSWSADSLYFHAGYRAWEKIPTRPESDLTLLSATGPGRYVGTELNVRNHLEHYWWGEGDEKVYVDGESFPSIFGTGTEDYFGYAWCVQYFRFAHAYHGVPKPSRVWLVVPQMSTLLIPKSWVPISKLMPGYDTTSQYRWHILDDIPFEKSIRFDLEVLHHQKTVVDMESVSYWYAAPGAGDDLPPLDLKNRKIW